MFTPKEIRLLMLLTGGYSPSGISRMTGESPQHVAKALPELADKLTRIFEKHALESLKDYRTAELYRAPDRRPQRDLTQRQFEVLQLVHAGWRASEIAVLRGRSIFTIQNHTRAIRTKFGARTLTDALAEAFRRGLIVAERPK